MRLGRDTIALEQFSRTADRLEGRRLLRAPKVELTRYSATLAPDGSILRFESAAVPLAGDSAAPASATVEFGMDSVRVTLVSGEGTRAYATALHTREGSVFLPFSYALYEQLVRRTLGRGVDSAPAELIFPGVLAPLPTGIRRTAPDSAALDFFGAPLRLRIDRAGRILGADGSATTQKVTVTRVRRVDLPSLARAAAAAERAGGPAGQLSPRDTVRATVGGAEVIVDYGRPGMRGREIFGGLVPWNEVWRTGANAATGLTVSAPLLVGGAELPAGSYTLYTLPRPGGAELIVNRQTGQWGTEYDAAADLVRVPLAQRTLDAPVERFTIVVEPAGRGAVLRLAWDRTEWTTTLVPDPTTP
ncbi:MAG TPA: DUF2911 domain-containing protein [Gemmatimonadales bacterium]